MSYPLDPKKTLVPLNLLQLLLLGKIIEGAA